MAYPVSDEAFDTIFRKARSYNGWQEKDVPETLVRATYDLHKWGPTSANCSPARYLFLRSAEAKGRLIPHLSAQNQEKSRKSPWVVIIANDMKFEDKIYTTPRLMIFSPV
jgi:3-hydroxypropanoate dehydrogenase